MNKKIEILCIVLLVSGLLLVATLVIREYLSDKSPSKRPNYPSAVYAKYQFYLKSGRAKIIVALKISLKDGLPQAMYLRNIARKRGKPLKLNLGTTANKKNYVANDAKGRSYGFYWDKEKSKIAHSFSYSTKKGGVYFGRLLKRISAQQWLKLNNTANKRKSPKTP